MTPLLRHLPGRLGLAFLTVLLALGSGQGARALPPAGERALEAAARLADAGRLDDALRAYVDLAGDGDGPTAAAASLEASHVERRLGLRDAARRRAAELARVQPETPWAAGARWLVADLDLQAVGSGVDLEAARRGFREVVQTYPVGRWPGLPWRVAAQVRIGEIDRRLGDSLAAEAAFAAALLDTLASPWSERAAVGLAEILLARGEWADAARHLQSVRDRGAEGSEAARAGRRLALVERLVVRPLAGESRWRTARVLGAELRRPEGVAVDDEGRLLVSDRSLDALLVLDDGGRIAARRDDLPSGRPFWGADGAAWLAAGDALLSLNPAEDTALADPARPDRQAADLEAGAPSGAGAVAVLWGRGRVTLFPSSPGSTPRDLVSPTSTEPADVAAGVAGCLYVLDRKRSAVERFAADGSALGTVALGVGQRPAALAVDSAANVYVLDRGSRSVGVYSASGELLERLGPDLPGGVRLDAPQDLAVDGAGRLYIADRGLRGVVVIE